MNEASTRSFGLRLYVAAVIAAGTVVLAHSVLASMTTTHPLVWAAIAALTILTSGFQLNLASVSASISVSDTFFIAAALLFGPGPATLMVAADSGFMSWRRGHSWSRVAFNAAALAMSMWVGAQAFFFAAGVPPLLHGSASIARLPIPVLLLALVYFALNSTLLAVAIGLEGRESPLVIWKRHLRWLAVGYLGAASVAFCLVLLIQQASIVAAVMVLPLLAVFHLTLRASFGRLEDARRHLGDLDRLYMSTVETLAMAIDAKDDVTHSHVRRVQAYAVGVARALSIDDKQSIKAIEAAALLHDTGKLAVPEHILNKPGKLTESEFEKMKTHVDVGADILSLVQFPYPVEAIVRAHHENWDGTGYPRGLKGEEIPVGARILSVADCFDALTSDRPYRRRMTEEAALDILRQRRGSMYDPHVVDTFVARYREIPVDKADEPEREVMRRIRQSRSEPQTSGAADCKPKAEIPAAMQTPAASNNVLGFVSLARLATGDGNLSDVLALSSNLIRDIVPGASGAWYVPDGGRDRMTVAHAFGPAENVLGDMVIGIGQRLTGWVAASRQSIVNSDAALDLEGRAAQATPPLTHCMSVPLLLGGSLVGVLSLYSSSGDVFDETRGRVIEMIAPHIAGALQGAKRAASHPEEVAAAEKTSSLRLVSTR